LRDAMAFGGVDRDNVSEDALAQWFWNTPVRP
jgi:hypothetical protein